MRSYPISQTSSAGRGPSPSVLKPRISSVLVLFLLTISTSAVLSSAEAQEGEIVNDATPLEDENHGYGREEIQRIVNGLQKDSVGASSAYDTKATSHKALQPLDDYVNSKRKHSINKHLKPSSIDNSANSQGQFTESLYHKSRNARNDADISESQYKPTNTESQEGYANGEKVRETKKPPTLSRSNKSRKEAQGTKHGPSITMKEIHTSKLEKLSVDGMSTSEREIVDRHEHQYTKQRKSSSRKRGKQGSRGKKSTISRKEKHASKEFQSLKGMYTIEHFRPKNIPQTGVSNKNSQRGPTPTLESIDHSLHSSPPDFGKGEAVLEDDISSHTARLSLGPSMVPSKSEQGRIFQIPSASPPRNTNADELQASWGRKLGPKGSSALVQKQESAGSINSRENRGRRHLDGKEEGERHTEEAKEKKDREYKTPELARGQETHSIKESNDDSKVELSKGHPSEWGNWGTHHEGEMNEGYHYPYDGGWGSGGHENMEDLGHFPDYGNEDERNNYDYHQLIRIDNLPLHHTTGIHRTNSESGCGCWETDAQRLEVECTCWGPDVKQIPTNFSQEVFQITVMDCGLDTLKNDSFTRYRATLRDIVLSNVKDFHSIEAGAFRGLRKLRSIYIHSAPMLKSMPNLTFTEDNTNLKSLRIVSSGLERVPNMQFTGPKEIFHMIELDSNRIQRVDSRSLQVRVEELSLNYNQIESVEKEAFAGSYIGKLSLKGNQKLTYLDPDAFKGIGSLRTLDLSETSITSLPTTGLTELEVLLLEDTPTLKVFPSVYSFKTIKEAHLTYPYHCCAFQFPEQHDREKYISHKKTMELETEHCSELTSPSTTSITPTTRVRRRRRALPDANSPADASQISRASLDATKLPESLVKADMDRGSKLSSTLEEESLDRFRTGTWSKESGIILSSIRTESYERLKRMKAQGMRKAEKQFTFRDSLLPVSKENPSFTEMKSTSNRKVRNTDRLTSNEKVHPKTRHFVHRGRHSRIKTNASFSGEMDATSMLHRDLNIYQPDHPKHRINPRYEPLRAPHFDESRKSESTGILGTSKERNDHQNFIPIPNKRFETIPVENLGTTASDIFEPVPEKRFGEEEMPPNQEGPLDDSFYGVGVGAGGFPNYFQGFGSFNHTSGRYPSTETELFNDTYHGSVRGLGQNVPIGSGLPLDHDGLLHPVGLPDFHAEGGFIDVDDGGFGDGGFVDTHPKDDDDDDDEDTNKHENNHFWHPTRAPMNNTIILVLCGNFSKNYHDVKCVPAPDAFNPCEDIMGNLALRVAVWFVVVTAVVGNLAVMLVLVSSKFRMTVSKFLMVNLALADLCMGIYLLIIASMDLHTIGVYFNYAIDWQNGPGCKVAGFLTVFASELSIFTLTVITSERWYAITYAIHLNKRLKLSMAAKIMVIGWIYSITMATLPLVGISGYSKTSICLPMETGNALALAYLISLLLVNGLAFFVITACYASMYCSISRHDASASHSDLTVAKRMALLVFTDFACWAPIAFFGLTAVAGIPLINVTRAKILLVFFYPLNSCANPYLYAILTKQYRRDLFILLARYGFCTKRAMKYKGAYSSVNNTFPHNTVVNAPNNHRNSTLTQITLCDLTRTARASQQSNNGSLLGTMIGGSSQDSLQRSISPSRTPTKPETCCGDTERLSTVQEMSHSNHSDDDNSEHGGHQQDDPGEDSSSVVVVKQAGSPHPIKNCYTRLTFTPEQEQILKRALDESKARDRNKKNEDRENGKNCLRENEMKTKENGSISRGSSPSGQGEAIVMCEVEVNKAQRERPHVENEFDEIEEATSSV